MQTHSETPARLLRIRGLVQGVGYRNALLREATRLGLSGWVRNRSDGSVEALVAFRALLLLVAAFLIDGQKAVEGDDLAGGAQPG